MGPESIALAVVVFGTFVALSVVRRRRAAAAKSLLDAGAAVLDVRTPGEFAGGHLPRARNVPVSELASRLREIEKQVGGKDRPIVVYCRSGNRSALAERILKENGFSVVVNGGAYDTLAHLG